MGRTAEQATDKMDSKHGRVIQVALDVSRGRLRTRW